MKIYLYILFLFLIPSLSFSQIVISENGEIIASGTANVVLTGNWTNNATNTGFTATTGAGAVKLNGSATQTIDGTKTTIFNKFEIDNTNGVELGTDISISDLTFTNGIISTATNKIDMPHGATITGAGADAFVNGTIAKTGNDAFKFEIGDSVKYSPIEISAPADIADVFTAKYFWKIPPDRSNVPSNIIKVSGFEYWNLDRTNGTSQVDVTMHWEDSKQSKIGDVLKHLFFVQHNGTNAWDSAWTNPTATIVGKGDITSTQTGSITKNSVSEYGYFTFGTDNLNNNVLPIELLNFTAICQNHGILLEWETASEINDDYFTILRSTNAVDFIDIDTVKGAGNSNTILDYSYIDWGLTDGIAYYELEQTDYNGTHTYYEIHEVNCIDDIDSHLLIYPNPTKDHFKIISTSEELDQLNVYNALGQDVTLSTTIISHHETVITVDISNLSNGFYTIKTKTASSKVLKD